MRTPESQSPAAAYGSCLHDVIEYVEDGHTDETAVEMAWVRWGSLLDPEDLALLSDDLSKYRERDPQGVKTVLSEGEIRFYLCTLDDGRKVYFRGRIDRLYERLDRPGSFIHIDYKTSKWQKNQDECDEDLQMWAYNLALYEFFPEIEDLSQVYDQFRHGQVNLLPKTDDQREQMRQWLITQARIYFTREHDGEDGLAAPRFNEWCPWCALIMDCKIIPELSDWARGRIKILGGDLPEDLESVTTPIDQYVEHFTDAQTAIKTLTVFVDGVKTLIKEVPASESARLDFSIYERKNNKYVPEAAAAIHERLGPRFYEMVTLPQKQLEAIEDEDVRNWALGLAEKVPGARVVTKRRR